MLVSQFVIEIIQFLILRPEKIEKDNFDKDFFEVFFYSYNAEF